MGISLSTSTRRRTPTHPYHTHTHPLDYYPPYLANPNAPLPVHSPSLYYPFYNSDAYTVCNHVNPLVSQPYFGPFEVQARVVAPQSTEQKQARVVNSEVNVHKDSLRLEVDELNRDRYLVSFVFDALVDGSITIYYFAKVDNNRRVVPLFPETYVPIKVPFRKGLHQEFLQPSGTGIDLRFFSLDDLSNPSSRDDVFPIVIAADICPTPYIVDDRNYIMGHTLPQMQITQVAMTKNQDCQYTAKAIRQLLWNDGVFYELREIYGFGKPSPGSNDNGSVKECVICMTEPKDMVVLPCRHMCMCSSCAKALRLQSNKCPICREIIEALLEIKIDDIPQ